jgi:hypothetical protein
MSGEPIFGPAQGLEKSIVGILAFMATYLHRHSLAYLTKSQRIMFLGNFLSVVLGHIV